MFWNKKTKENENPTLQEQVRRVNHRLSLLEAEILDLATAQNILRNKVLKKIQFKNPKTEENEQKDLYSGMFLPE